MKLPNSMVRHSELPVGHDRGGDSRRKRFVATPEPHHAVTLASRAGETA